MKIVTRQPLDSHQAQAIDPTIDIVRVETNEELLREAVDAEIAVGIDPDIFEELVRSSDTLKWVHTSVAGADRFITPALGSKRVVLTCAKGGPAGRNLAEHALGLALSLSRNIGESARSKHWRREELSRGPHELSEKTFGIVGYGAAGRDLVEITRGFRPHIIATKRTGPFDESAGLRFLPASRLAELLGESDVVFNFLPTTAATERVFDHTAFDLMKETACFVNVGRGSTVDTDALVAALETGAIAGAGIDTVDPEPLPEGHPLWSIPNVVITPHIAGVSPERSVRNRTLFFDNLKRYLAGRPLVSVVDPEAGY